MPKGTRRWLNTKWCWDPLRYNFIQFPSGFGVFPIFPYLATAIYLLKTGVPLLLPFAESWEDGEVMLENKTEVGECRKECTTLMHACRFLAQKDGCLWRWWGDWFKRALGKSSIFDVSKVPKTQTEDKKLPCLQKWGSLIKTTAPNCRGNNLICLPQIWGIWIMGISGYPPQRKPL